MIGMFYIKLIEVLCEEHEIESFEFESFKRNAHVLQIVMGSPAG